MQSDRIVRLPLFEESVPVLQSGHRYSAAEFPALRHRYFAAELPAVRHRHFAAGFPAVQLQQFHQVYSQQLDPMYILRIFVCIFLSAAAVWKVGIRQGADRLRFGILLQAAAAAAVRQASGLSAAVPQSAALHIAGLQSADLPPVAAAVFAAASQQPCEAARQHSKYFGLQLQAGLQPASMNLLKAACDVRHRDLSAHSDSRSKSRGRRLLHREPLMDQSADIESCAVLFHLGRSAG